MDLVSGLKNELFKPLVTLAVPGSVALGPYIMVVCARVPQALAFWKEHDGAFSAAVVVAVLAAGLLLEDVGARIETSQWDPRLRKQLAASSDEWHAYLRLRTGEEVVGQRYLRTIVTRMKFELAMSVALVLHALGLCWLNALHPTLTLCEMAGVAIAAIGLGAYLLWESYTSAYALVELRRDVIAACVAQPVPAQEVHVSLRVEGEHSGPDA